MPAPSTPLHRWLGIDPDPPEGAHGWWLFPSPQQPRLYLPVHRAGWRTALDLISSRKRRIAARLMLETYALLRRRPDLRGGPGTLDAWLAEIWPAERTRKAVYIGTASAFAKDTIQCQSETGTALGYVKVPRGPRAAEAVGREAETLEFLAREFPHQAFFPRLLGRRDGLSLQSAPGPERGEGQGTAGNAGEILALLAARTTRPLPWAESSGHRAILHAIQLLADDPARRTRLERVLLQLTAAFGQTQLEHCLSHGDFVPWNLRGRFAFDWEWAEERLRWHDAFHFLCYPAILHGARGGIAALESAWNGAAGQLLRANPKPPAGDPTAGPAGMLAYLAVQYAFHVEASLGHGDSLSSFPFLAVMEDWMAQGC